MQTQPAVTTAPKARAEQAEGAINLKPLREALTELETAAQRIADMQGAYSDLLHTVAIKTGLAAPVIRSFIGARMAESEATTARKKERAGQLALVFEEIQG